MGRQPANVVQTTFPPGLTRWRGLDVISHIKRTIAQKGKFMSYASALTQIGTNHRAEIEADLALARREFEQAQTALEKAARRVHMLESLLQPLESASVETDFSELSEVPGKMTLHSAMQKVLRESQTGRLRAGEIIAEIKRRNLYRMKDGRLPESQQIHARASHYPELFGKEGSFFFAK